MSHYIKNAKTGFYIGTGRPVNNGYAIILKETIDKGDVSFLWSFNKDQKLINQQYNSILTSNGAIAFTENGSDYLATWAAVHPFPNDYTTFVISPQPNNTYIIFAISGHYLCVAYPNGDNESPGLYLEDFDGSSNSSSEYRNWYFEEA